MDSTPGDEDKYHSCSSYRPSSRKLSHHQRKHHHRHHQKDKKKDIEKNYSNEKGKEVVQTERGSSVEKAKRLEREDELEPKGERPKIAEIFREEKDYKGSNPNFKSTESSVLEGTPKSNDEEKNNSPPISTTIGYDMFLAGNLTSVLDQLGRISDISTPQSITNFIEEPFSVAIENTTTTSPSRKNTTEEGPKPSPKIVEIDEEKVSDDRYSRDIESSTEHLSSTRITQAPTSAFFIESSIKIEPPKVIKTQTGSNHSLAKTTTYMKSAITDSIEEVSEEDCDYDTEYENCVRDENPFADSNKSQSIQESPANPISETSIATDTPHGLPQVNTSMKMGYKKVEQYLMALTARSKNTSKVPCKPNERNKAPLVEFIEFGYENGSPESGDTYIFTKEDSKYLKDIDDELALAFVTNFYHWGPILAMNLIFSIQLVVGLLYSLGIFSEFESSEDAHDGLELVHIIFFELICGFLIFLLGCFACKEVKVNGRWIVKSYVGIYLRIWKSSIFNSISSIRSKLSGIDICEDVEFNADKIGYWFVHDWFGDGVYKVLKAKLIELKDSKNKNAQTVSQLA